MADFYDELSVHDICALMGQTTECMCLKPPQKTTIYA